MRPGKKRNVLAAILKPILFVGRATANVMRSNQLSNAILGLAILSSLAAWPALAKTTPNTTIQVTNSNDSGPGSLRDAIQSAQPGDTIVFGVSGITLSSTLSIDTSLTISGPGASNLAIVRSRINDGSVFLVSPGVTAAISGMTISGGFAMFGGGIYNAGTLTLSNSTVSGNRVFFGMGGGGIYNTGTLTVSNSSISGNDGFFGGGAGITNARQSTLTLTNSTVSDNYGADTGSGIDNSGTATISSSTISGNDAFMGGGGIENGGTLTLSNSTVSGNTARGFGDSFGGGGINNFGTAIIRNSTVSGNGGPFGGGISNAFGTLTVINSTLFGNYAAYSGGGIANAGTLTVSNSTLSENYSVCDGGAISTPISFSLCIPGIGNSAPTTLKNTIVANSRSGGNCQGTFISAGHNVSDDASCSFSGPGDLNNTPAGLDPGGLKDNGGPTHTIALLPTSPAVDGVPLSSCTAVDGTPIATDQRGIPRPQGLACDIGAYEYLAITAPAPTSGTTCNGAYNGTFSGNITVSAGQNCIFFNGGVTGDVQQYGGSFVLFQSKVGGDVQVKGGGTFSIGPSSTINGNLQIQNLPGGSGQNQVCGTTVGGDLQFQNSGTAVLIGGPPPSPCSGNTVGGNLQVQNNWASTSVVGNTVSGNLMDQNNTGPTQVFNNTVSGNLHCQNDTTIQGGGNVVTNQKQGQCAGF